MKFSIVSGPACFPASNRVLVSLRADRLIDTNSMELAVYGNDAEEQILAIASLDNLGKGASGAAVQVINLKTGVPETTGLAVAA